MERKAVKTLNAEVARKIAAGEVIDRPQAIVRELLDNAVDSGADSIDLEIKDGGIEKIRVIDNGCGMTKEDLFNAARPHATSKISSESDLLKLTTLGFRGEALSSMAAVSRLEIRSGGFKMNASITQDHEISSISQTKGTIVQTEGLFENFPARRMFLKRPASEGQLCRSMFEEKALPRPDIAFSFTQDDEKKIVLPKTQSLKERFSNIYEYSDSRLFYELKSKGEGFDFNLIIGEPSVTCDTRKKIFIYVNGRKIQEYSLVQAIEYGCQGYFPNGSHPVACLFVNMDSSLVDFNIHPAKREARFKDISTLHHSVSSTTRQFFKEYTVKEMLDDKKQTVENAQLEFNSPSLSSTALEDENTPIIKNADYSSVQRHKISSDSRSRFFDSYSTRTNTNPYNEKLLKKTIYQSNSFDDNNSIDKDLNELKKNDDSSFRYIGCALGTFIIAQKNDTLYIIDQHAADERYRYNDLIEHSGQKQKLLIPYEIQTSSTEDDLYLEKIKEKLNEAGFEIKNTGNGKWECYSTPLRWKGNKADLEHDLLDKRVSPEEIISSIAAMTACRSAVMDGHYLDDNKASEIAQRALNLPDPHCPHGRPVFTSITRQQLFALVKRTF